MSKYRNVCFTLNIRDWDGLRELDPSLWPGCKYAVYQLEEAPTTGQLHWQGYIEFDRTMSLTALQSLDGLEGAHFETRRGSAQQAADYCKKEGALTPFVEWGTISNQGKRSDLHALFERARAASTLREVAEEHPASFIRYTRGITAVRTLYQVGRHWAPKLLFYIGRSGCGKTRKAAESFPEAYWKAPGTWWDGYDEHEVVIFDEFYGSSMPFSTLLRLLDRYPIRVETKGGTTQFLAKTIIFTSNQHPSKWYDAEKTHQGPWASNPFKRRIDEFGELYEWSDVTQQFIRTNGHDPAIGAPQNDNPFEIAEVDEPIIQNNNNEPDFEWPFIDAEFEIQFDRDQ